MTTPTLIDQSNGLDDDEPGESILQEELQLLEAIYVNELTLQKDDKDWPSCLSVRLHPATGDVQEQQYVCLTLELTPPHDYPTSLPGIAIRNPRGLAEEHVNDLRKTLGDLAQERRGYPMLYELIECAKDSLTHGNVPHGHCAICRDDFDTETELTRTDCYHYFHSHCLLRYVTHCVTTATEEEEHRLPHADTRQDRQVVCPVCREVITYDISALGSVKPISDNNDVFRPSPSVRKLQRQMAALFARQKAKGGIIDVEAEKNKFLLPQGPLYLPTVQDEDAAVGTEPDTSTSETACGGTLPKDDVAPDACDTREGDIHDRKYRDYPSHRGRGRGRGRGRARRWERESDAWDGERHFGHPRRERRSETHQGRDQHNETSGRLPRERLQNEKRNETFSRESQYNVRGNEAFSRRGQQNDRRNETFSKEGQQNERRNETLLRESQRNESRNETGLKEGQQNERRNERNLRDGRRSERRNNRGVRIGEHVRRNETCRSEQRNETKNEITVRQDQCNEQSERDQQRRTPSDRTSCPEGASTGAPEKENVFCSTSSSHREVSSRGSHRPHSGNRRAGGGRRGNRGWVSHGLDADGRGAKYPHQPCREESVGTVVTTRGTTDCCVDHRVTNCPTPSNDHDRAAERGKCSPVKHPPPGLQVGNRPPPGFGHLSTGS